MARQGFELTDNAASQPYGASQHNYEGYYYMSRRLWDKGISLDTDVLAFTTESDLEHDATLAAYDAVASAAHARMLAGIGILSEQECLDLLAELHIICQESVAGTFIITAELEDCHTAIETRLTAKLGDVGKKIHTGRSRNDQVLVAMRLAVRHRVLLIMEKLFALAKVLIQRARTTTDIAIPGYTHTQKAMPTTASTLMLSYCQYVISLLQDGMGMYRLINWNPLGVGSGFGVPLHLDRHHTSTLLGFEREQPNPIFVQSTRGREELKFLTWICDISLLIERAASDLILFSTEEFGFVHLPEKFTTGSSIMPQKRNPDVLELLRAQGSLNRASRSELENIMSKLPSSYHRDYQYTKDSVFKASKRMTGALKVFASVMNEIIFDKEHAKKMLTPELFSTHYAYELVSKEQLPFRTAYLKAAEALKAKKIDPLVYIESFLQEEHQKSFMEIDEAYKRIIAGEELYQRTLQAHYDVCENVFIKTES